MAIKIPKKDLGKHIALYFLILILILVGISIKSCSDRNKETEYTYQSKLYDPVYADIVSITPESGTTKAMKKNTSYEGYFCSCITADGRKFNAYITITRFSKYIQDQSYSFLKEFIPNTVEFDTPLRVHGKIFTRDDILNSKVFNGSSHIFNIFSSDRETK